MVEQNIKKMATLLRSGATMLDKYCPNCNNILFRLKNEKIYCPICDREVIIVNNDLENKKSQIAEEKIESSNNIPIKKHISNNLLKLNDIFFNLVSRLSKKLEETDDLLVIEKIISNISQTLDLIIKIKKIS
ncbi:Sjogren's syndrome/scleroderma autoantigen 1 family protein [Promethearchaeum syntrophicum]|uniref:Sjogren's syndrome/scleroderma autoantigen 1 family protein n=1 Tax=Promethearchaeum syntrophicum TaxID=2594042 RepID=A0A5B9D727_9ARCH|nr:Sjogren's syndrome/scleroderma autoantigen 1 family protein [Candidatus Prometheoarchaeum syntrophicum]QEE14862.1 hypothetical protein DSAG12_00683 [Candidatus Prometheoarchaeum syntrophicum]